MEERKVIKKSTEQQIFNIICFKTKANCFGGTSNSVMPGLSPTHSEDSLYQQNL